MNPKAKDDSILVLLKEKENREYFFNNYDKPRLFYRLKESGYFDPDKEPLPQLTEDGQYIKTPYWDVLSYLEKISLKHDIPDYDKYCSEILQIMKNVVDYHDSNKIENDNYSTWWYFIKILVHIPNNLISLNVLEYLRMWIGTRINNAILCSEIVEKLIPKFLTGDSLGEDIEKAELIIDIVSDIKLTKKKNIPEDIDEIFGNEDKYELICDGFYFKEFIDKNYELIAKQCSNKLIYNLCGKLKKSLNKEINTYTTTEDDYNIHFAISCIGNEYNVHTEAYFRGDRYFGLNKMFGKKLIPEKSLTFRFIANNLVEFTELFQNKLIDNGLIKSNNIRMKLSRGRYIYYGPYSVNCWESLDKEEYLSYYNADDMILNALIKILCNRSEINIISTKKILGKLFLDDYYILKKLALLVMGKSSQNYSNIFWKAFKKGDNSNILLEESFFGDELKNALAKVRLSVPKQKELLRIIEEGPKFHYCEVGDDYFNRWKQIIYKALSHHALIMDKYDELFELTKKEYELRPAIGEIKTEFIDERANVSQVSIEDVLKLSNDEIADKILKIKVVDEFESSDNFYPSFLEAVKTTPEKFTSSLLPFLKTYPNDIFNLLYSLNEAWKNKKNFVWDKLFDFISAFMDKIKFSDIAEPPDFSRGPGSVRDIIGFIGILIQDGTKSDDNAFSSKYNDKASSVLLKILSNYKNVRIPHNDVDYHDSYMFALNTILGRNICALIFLSLREARIKYGDVRDDRVKWRDHHKNIYEILLKKEIFEAYLYLGNSIRNFLYLDPIWIKEKVLKIKEMKDSNLPMWVAFMDGYLTNQNIGVDLYIMMKDNYLMSIDFEFKDESSRRGLIRHISLAYLGGSDDIKEGLMSKIIIRNDYDDFREIINHFWAQREVLLLSVSPENDVFLRLTEQKNLIREFWKNMYEIYRIKTSFTDNEKKILAQLGRLAVYIDKINDENVEWLKLSALHITSDYVSPYFIEYLNILKDKGDDISETAIFVSEVFLEILENATPDYDMKHIKEIIEFVYLSKNKQAVENANIICETYTIRSNYSLKELWEKYN